MLSKIMAGKVERRSAAPTDGKAQHSTPKLTRNCRIIFSIALETGLAEGMGVAATLIKSSHPKTICCQLTSYRDLAGGPFKPGFGLSGDVHQTAGGPHLREDLLFQVDRVTGGAPLLAVFEKWPAAHQDFPRDRPLVSLLDGAHRHCPGYLASLSCAYAWPSWCVTTVRGTYTSSHLVVIAASRC